MPKINSSSVKICESSRPRLAQKFSIVTRAVVIEIPFRKNVSYYFCKQQTQITAIIYSSSAKHTLE